MSAYKWLGTLYPMNVVLDNCAIISYFVAILIRQYFPGIPIPLIFFITFFNT